jgi:hypothetical protein
MQARNGDLDVGNCGKAKRDEESLFLLLYFLKLNTL